MIINMERIKRIKRTGRMNHAVLLFCQHHDKQRTLRSSDILKEKKKRGILRTHIQVQTNGLTHVLIENGFFRLCLFNICV